MSRALRIVYPGAVHLYANLLECLSVSLGCEKCRFDPMTHVIKI